MSATNPIRWRRCLLAAVTAGVCVVALGGRGSGGHKPSASSHASSELDFSECMRSHGVTGFPDPSPGGGGLNIAGTGINPSSPAFKAAQATRKKLLPGGGPGSRHATEQPATCSSSCRARSTSTPPRSSRPPRRAIFADPPGPRRLDSGRTAAGRRCGNRVSRRSTRCGARVKAASDLDSTNKRFECLESVAEPISSNRAAERAWRAVPAGARERLEPVSRRRRSLGKRRTGFEPATSSLGSLRSTD